MPDPLFSLDSTSYRLGGLLAQITSALEIADELDLHAAGIALDTARLAVEEALGRYAVSHAVGALPPS